MLVSWVPKTCGKTNIKEPFKALLVDDMAFLSQLLDNGDGNYGVVAVARTVLSAILPKQGNVTCGKDSNVSRMLRRIFNSHR